MQPLNKIITGKEFGDELQELFDKKKPDERARLVFEKYMKTKELEENYKPLLYTYNEVITNRLNLGYYSGMIGSVRQFWHRLQGLLSRGEFKTYRDLVYERLDDIERIPSALALAKASFEPIQGAINAAKAISSDNINDAILKGAIARGKKEKLEKRARAIAPFDAKVAALLRECSAAAEAAAAEVEKAILTVNRNDDKIKTDSATAIATAQEKLDACKTNHESLAPSHKKQD